MATKNEDPIFAEYRRTSRVGDIEFWLKLVGPKMTPQTRTDFEALLESARATLAKRQMPTGATLQRYIVLTQRYWRERPEAERRQTHMPEFRLYDEHFKALTDGLNADVEKGLSSKAATTDVYGWTVVIAKQDPTETRFSKWMVTATLGEEVCELSEAYERADAIRGAQSFLQRRLHDQFQALAFERSAAAVPAPEPEPVAEVEPPLVISYGSTEVHRTIPTPTPTPEPVATAPPVKAGRLLTWRYVWTENGQTVEGELLAGPSEKAARQAIRDQFNLKWVPNGATVARAS